MTKLSFPDDWMAILFFLLFFQNGGNRAISEGIQKSLLGAINGGKQTADVSKMHLGSSTQCISTP